MFLAQRSSRPSEFARPGKPGGQLRARSTLDCPGKALERYAFLGSAFCLRLLDRRSLQSCPPTAATTRRQPRSPIGKRQVAVLMRHPFDSRASFPDRFARRCAVGGYRHHEASAARLLAPTVAVQSSPGGSSALNLPFQCRRYPMFAATIKTHNVAWLAALRGKCARHSRGSSRAGPVVSLRRQPGLSRWSPCCVESWRLDSARGVLGRWSAPLAERLPAVSDGGASSRLGCAPGPAQGLSPHPPPFGSSVENRFYGHVFGWCDFCYSSGGLGCVAARLAALMGVHGSPSEEKFSGWSLLGSPAVPGSQGSRGCRGEV